jgi:hypothetical protein
MPIYHRTYSPGALQFITTATCRRAPVFFCPRFRMFEKIIGNVIPTLSVAKGRNLALLLGLYVPQAGPDSSLRSE